MSWMDWIKTKVAGRPAAHDEPAAERAGAQASERPARANAQASERPTRADAHASERGERDPKIAKLNAAISAARDERTRLTLHFERGTAYRERGVAREDPEDLERALADFAHVTKVAPALGQVHMARGECLLRLGKHEAALDSFDRAIALLAVGVSLAGTHLNRAIARAALGEIDDALADLTRAAQLAPELAEAADNQRLRIERSRSGAAPARRTPRYDERDALPAGWELDQSGDVVGALIAFGTAIARDPSARAYYARGVANCKLHRYPEALADLDRALELRPRYAAALTERGLTQLESGAIDQAIADYDRAIAIDPAYGLAHENKGLALLKQERWADAVPCLDLALRIRPGVGRVLYHRGLAHEMLGDLPRALRDLQASLASGPSAQHVAFAQQRVARLKPRVASVDPAKPGPESLWSLLTGISLDTTVAELAARTHAERMYFAELALHGGERTFVPLYGPSGLLRRLTEIADVIGPRILSMTLRQFEDLVSSPAPPRAPADPAPRAPEPLQPPRAREFERLVEKTELHVLTNGKQVVGLLSGIPHHDLDLPTSLDGARPLFERNDQPDQRRPCPACQRSVAYFEPVLEHDQLTGYACPHCGESPIPRWIEDRMPGGRWSRAGFLGPTERLPEVVDRDARTLQRLGLDHARLADALDHLLTTAFRASAARINQAGAEHEDQMRASGQRGIHGLAMIPLGATLDELEAQLGRGEPLPADRSIAVDGHDVFLQIYLGYQYCPFTILRRPWCDDPPPRVTLRRVVDGVGYVTEPPHRDLPCDAEHGYRHANLEFLIVRRDTRQALRGAGLLVHLIRDHRFFEGEHSPFRLDPERAAQVLGLI